VKNRRSIDSTSLKHRGKKNPFHAERERREKIPPHLPEEFETHAS
jgi:hypothetical protein